MSSSSMNSFDLSRPLAFLRCIRMTRARVLTSYLITAAADSGLISPTVLADLEAFDAMADVLAQERDSRAVPIELVLSTSLRALRALGTLLSSSITSCSGDLSRWPNVASGTRAAAGSGAAASSGASSGFRLLPGFGSSNGAASGVRQSLAALSLVDSTLHRLIPAVFSSLSRYRSTTGNTSASGFPQCIDATRAMDDLLGWVYALVLHPLVLAFAPLSEGFLCASLMVQPKSGPCSGVSYAANSPLPRARASIAREGADLRPLILELLDKTLALSVVVGKTRLPGLLRMQLGVEGLPPERVEEQLLRLDEFMEFARWRPIG